MNLVGLKYYSDIIIWIIQVDIIIGSIKIKKKMNGLEEYLWQILFLLLLKQY